jgi:predicted nucleotidyltransferase
MTANSTYREAKVGYDGLADEERFYEGKRGSDTYRGYAPQPARCRVRVGIHTLFYTHRQTTGTEEIILATQVMVQRKRRSPVFQKLRNALPAIRTRYGVKRIGIFGSFARSEQTRSSDVVDGQATFDNFMQLVYVLEDLFGRKVDLLTVRGIDKYIRSRVEREVIWVEG